MLQWIEEPGQCQLKKTIGGNFDAVRSAFLQEVSAYSSKDLRVMVAFDAIGNLSAPPIARYIFPLPPFTPPPLPLSPRGLRPTICKFFTL